eukprot:TRINITY_DN2058_c0_g1_i1.p1 TRINITY_DN2058_c0_g1~~TRINITY_DN2058_c0_g1_i1.p1  ORF type:complete len:521 (+),score=114.14 TRINITY_DN2058_c0_g1_i1:242-1804(+)
MLSPVILAVPVRGAVSTCAPCSAWATGSGRRHPLSFSGSLKVQAITPARLASSSPTPTSTSTTTTSTITTSTPTTSNPASSSHIPTPTSIFAPKKGHYYRRKFGEELEPLFAGEDVYRPVFVTSTQQYFNPWKVVRDAVVPPTSSTPTSTSSSTSISTTESTPPTTSTPSSTKTEEVEEERTKQDPFMAFWKQLLSRKKSSGGNDQPLSPTRELAGAMFREDMLAKNLQPQLDKHLPVLDPDMERLYNPPAADSGEIQVTWIGHSTFYVQTGGISFLTDPVWGERASPLTFAGPKRHRKVPLPLDKLPPVDFVLLSHNHYDHLDYQVALELQHSDTKWFVPEGLGTWFHESGITNVVEMTWWDRYHLSETVSITASPAQHWTKRWAFGDTMKSLWASMSVEANGKKIYFSCDTGYCPAFSQVGDRLGPFDLSLIPIGAYSPRSIMQASHVDTEESTKMHLDLKSKFSIGTHWGTFPLTSEPVLEPPVLLKENLKKYGVAEEAFITMTPGQILTVPQAEEK